MTKSKHTPGPLMVGYYTPTEEFKSIVEHVCVMDSNRKVIATCGLSGDIKSQADAKLFADAPETARQRDELLEACKLMVEVWEGLPIPGLGKPGTSATKIDDITRLAIARAEGRDV